MIGAGGDRLKMSIITSCNNNNDNNKKDDDNNKGRRVWIKHWLQTSYC